MISTSTQKPNIFRFLIHFQETRILFRVVATLNDVNSRTIGITEIVAAALINLPHPGSGGIVPFRNNKIE